MRLLLSSLTNAFGDAQRTMVSSTVVVVAAGQKIVVGRDPSCAFVIGQDPLVSRHHFQIDNDGTKAIVRDLGSSNGTFVNGTQISQTELSPGDQIAAGKSFFKVGVLDAPESKDDPLRTSISFAVTKSEDGEISIVKETLPLQVALEIPSGDGKGLTTGTVSQLLPVLEAGDSRVFGRTAVGLDMIIRQDSQMSANHFELMNDGEAAWITDLESTNGLYLNGNRVSKARLRHDDLVLAGETTFRVNLFGGESPNEEELAAAIEAIEVAPVVVPDAPKPTPFQSPRLVNLTGLKPALIKGRVNYPGYSLTLVVKGTFDLTNGQMAALSEEQVYPCAEVRVAGDLGHEVIAYDSDFAYYKPRADVLFHGSCHAPNSVPVSFCRATLQVGRIQKAIDVYGDRFWESRLMGKASEPTPFVSMPINFERAYGGPKNGSNPIGRGVGKEAVSEGQTAVALPNLVEAGAEIRTSSERVAAASFTPIDAHWETRSSKLGTYDQRWQHGRAKDLWFPEDVSWDHFNSAPEGLQVEGWLNGDEEIRLSNLIPSQSEFVARLPCIRIRAFLSGAEDPNQSNASEARFREVEMRLDTAWIDGENAKLVLVWRGVTEVSHTFSPEVKHVFVHAESTSVERGPAGYYWQPFLDALAVEAGEWEMEPDEASDEEPPENAEPDGEGAPAATWVNPFDTLKLPSEKEQLDQLEKNARVSLIKQGVDPDNPPPLTPEQEEQQQALLQEWGLLENEEEADGSKTESNGESDPAIEKRRFVEEQIAQGASLAGADLSGADLSKLDLSGLDLTAANLSAANLRKSDLSKTILNQAVLVDANLEATTLHETDLVDADLFAANLLQAELRNVDLTNANLADSVLQHAKLESCVGEFAILTQANLAQAEFHQCRLGSAILDGAKMSQTKMLACDLTRSTFSDAVGLRCDFAGSLMENAVLRAALLPGSSFRDIQAKDSVWSEAELSDSSFSHAVLDKAEMSSTVLDQCDFGHATLRSTRLAYCSLKSANLVRTNLFRAMLEGADLTGADVSCSNLYGAELMDAIFDHAKCESTNFQATLFYAASGAE